MNAPIQLLGIAGSLRRQSYNRSALRAAAELLPEGARLEAFDLDGIPCFNEDLERTPPEKVLELRRRVRAADAIVIATPEYNYSIPGVLKNAIDWASRPYGESAWAGKPAAILGASLGPQGTVRAQYHLRQVMVYLDMFPLNKPEVLIGGASRKFDEQGRLTDEATQKLVRQLMHDLVAWTRRLAVRT